MRRRRRSTQPSPTGAGGAERTSGGQCREGVARTDPRRTSPIVARVATEALDSSHASTGLRASSTRDALGALVLAASIPFLFLHERYQPDLSVDAGATTVDIRLSDFADPRRRRLRGRRRGRAPASLGCEPRGRYGSAGRALLVWLAFQTFRPVSLDDALFDEHLVSFLKLVEYSLLAVAVAAARPPRRRPDHRARGRSSCGPESQSPSRSCSSSASTSSARGTPAGGSRRFSAITISLRCPRSHSRSLRRGSPRGARICLRARSSRWRSSPGSSGSSWRGRWPPREAWRSASPSSGSPRDAGSRRTGARCSRSSASSQSSPEG